MNKNISVIGGDTRQLFAGKYLADKGFNVSFYGCEHGRIPDDTKYMEKLSDVQNSDIIILPLPVTKNGNLLNTPLSSQEIKIKDVIEVISDKHIVFYGMGNGNVKKFLDAKAEKAIDYYNVESLIYKNALLTAEGILSIVLERTQTTVSGMKIAVTGYGRIGTFISQKLKLLDADVTVFARNDIHRTIAKANGIKAKNIDELAENIANFECIINTIPFIVINEEAIKSSRNDSIFIETASAPYGIDSEACTKHNRNLIKAFSLPGKTAPKSAGYIIGETIENILKEMNYE